MAAVTAATLPRSQLWHRVDRLSLNLLCPEAQRVSDPPLRRRRGSESETVTDAPVLPILDVGAQFPQRRHSPFHGPRRGGGVGITNGNECRRFGQGEIRMTGVEHDKSRGLRQFRAAKAGSAIGTDA